MKTPSAFKEENLHIPTRDISIWLDSYDDIFSDFDSRPYSGRVLSDDFIGELNKVSRENDLKIKDLKLLIPEKIRNKETEEIITKRLHESFRKNLHQMEIYKRKTILTYLGLLSLGFLLMILASYVGLHRENKIALNILFVILEPGGWFLVWTSLDQIFYVFKNKKSELDFYSRMAKCKISFVSIK